MNRDRLCLPCEHGEHGTIMNDLAHRVMQCDCACHYRPAVLPADPMLPKSSTQSMKLLLIKTNPIRPTDHWFRRVYLKLDSLFSPRKERV